MFRIPTITKNLLIINALMFLALIVFGRMGTDLNSVLGLHFFLAPAHADLAPAEDCGDCGGCEEKERPEVRKEWRRSF